MRGTIGGAMPTRIGAGQDDLQIAAGPGTTGYSFGGAAVILMMPEARTARPSPEMRQAVDAAGGGDVGTAIAWPYP